MQVSSDRYTESRQNSPSLSSLGDTLTDFPWLDICDTYHNLYLLTLGFISIEVFLELLDLTLVII